MITNIDGKTLQKMFLAGAKSLEAKKEWINELNVFPVPDGDTGTNMSLTIMSAASEVSSIKDPTLANLSKAISSGSLRGARGNSGVILSQLFRGFTKEVKQYDTIDAVILANACERAVETAYKAVMKPKEGTILTVAKGVSEKVREVVLESDDLEYMISEAVKYGDYVLSQTPEMLPVLKQAGVVDSGGQGLMQVLKGAYDAFLGKEIDYGLENDLADSKEEDLAKYTYSVELTILLNDNFDSEREQKLKGYLEGAGQTTKYDKKTDTISIACHTDEPGFVLSKSMKFGAIAEIQVNNKNIILAAEQAASLTKDKNIVVVPSKNVPQGINAIINFIQDMSADENKDNMISEMQNVKTGSVTYAVRDTVIDDKTIKQNDIMGIGDSGIISVGTDIFKTTVDMISNLIDEDSEIVSIYYGKEVNEDDANKLSEKISELYSDVEVVLNYGGQPIYYYVVSVE